MSLDSRKTTIDDFHTLNTHFMTNMKKCSVTWYDFYCIYLLILVYCYKYSSLSL